MRYMKHLMLLCMFTLLLPGIGFARAKNQGTMRLTEPARIGSTDLQPGTYKVEWNGTGPNVQVNIMRHNDTLATTTGELKTNPAATQDAVVLQPASDNSSVKQVSEIDFGSRKEALILTPGAMNRAQ